MGPAGTCSSGVSPCVECLLLPRVIGPQGGELRDRGPVPICYKTKFESARCSIISEISMFLRAGSDICLHNIIHETVITKPVKGSRHPPDRWSATSVILTWTSLGRFAPERSLVAQMANARHLYLYLVFDFSRRCVDRPDRRWIRPRPRRSTARSTLRCLDPLRGFHETPVALDLIGEKRATLIDVFPAEFACWTSCSERTAALFERALSFGFRPNPCEKSANPIISLLLPRGISTRITLSDSRRLYTCGTQVGHKRGCTLQSNPRKEQHSIERDRREKRKRDRGKGRDEMRETDGELRVGRTTMTRIGDGEGVAAGIPTTPAIGRRPGDVGVRVVVATGYEQQTPTTSDDDGREAGKQPPCTRTLLTHPRAESPG
ncbi:hypothetical protein ALC56_03245 [Trachymyrmex septentrionalis]|uniref:Uncharacterized protein n=1 Tax=Trachymyrmex septentrionalis TaxID=34720 RepID=A0A195FP65_9HYME|nr:hypothetical protein ALC56_03245 [Trachymyrmex septentrionalis]